MKILSKTLAGLAMAAGLGFGFAPLSAAPLPSPAAIMSPVAEAGEGVVQQAAYYRNRGWRNDRGWRRGGNWNDNRRWRDNRGWRQPNRYYSRPAMRSPNVTRLGNPATAGGGPRSSQ